MKWTGVLVRVDLGPGLWVLQTDDGKEHKLDGRVPEGLADKRVVVEGRRSRALGIGMLGGGTIEVKKVRRA